MSLGGDGMRRDDLTQLKEAKLSLITELRNIEGAANTAAEEHDGEWLTGDVEKFDKVEKEIRNINAKLDKSQRLFAAEQDVETVSLQVGTKAPETLSEYRNMNGTARPQDLPEVRTATMKYWLGGMDALTSEEKRDLSRASNSVGNALVPIGFENELVRAIRWIGSFGGAVREITTGDGMQLLVPTNLVHGTASWMSEAGSFGDIKSDETFDQQSLSAYKIGCKIIVSDELLQDSAFPLDSFLATEFGERISVVLETALMTGNGTGKPVGILDGSKGITVTEMDANGSADLAYTDVLQLVYDLPRQYREGASFFVSDDLAKQLYTMHDSYGRPLWNVNVAEGGSDTLYGYPINVHPNLESYATGNIPFVFGNWAKAYWLRRVDGVSMLRQNELHSDNGQVGFRGYLRVDGLTVNKDAARAGKLA